METSNISEEQIRKYLLGEAGPELEERLDELAFSDDYSEIIGSVENDLIDDYVKGALDPETRSAFESHYLSSPTRSNKLQVARGLARYAKVESEPLRSGAESPAPGFLENLWNFGTVFRLGLAACGLLIVSMVGWVFLRQGTYPGPVVAVVENKQEEAEPLPEPTPANTNVNGSVAAPTISPDSNGTISDPVPTRKPTQTPVPVVAVITLTPALRSGGAPEVRIEKGAKATFRLRLDTEEPGPFSAEIIDEASSATVWSARSVVSRRNRVHSAVTFTVPAGVVGEGIHRIVLSVGSGEGKENVGDYLFKVVQ